MSIINEQSEMQAVANPNIVDYDENRNNISQLTGSLDEINAKTGNNLLDIIFLKGQNTQKQTNRVCCIKIKKHWTIRMQMIVSLMVLSLAIFALVIGIVVGNIMLTRVLISQSSEESIQKQIQNNLKNSAQEYSNAIFEIFHGYLSTLEVMNKIVLSALKKEKSLFDFNYIREFPIRGKGRYFSVLDKTPTKLMSNTTDLSEILPGVNITLKTWQYGAFAYKQTENLQVRTQEGQQILQAYDILNYILEDFYQNKSVTNIHLIHFSLEIEKISIIYPGGVIYGITDFDPFERPWYQKAKNYFQQYKNQSDMQSAAEMIITGPYQDFLTNRKALTISKPIFGYDNLFLGVASIDILVNDLQQNILQIQYQKSGRLLLLDVYSGQILNQPYPYNFIYSINDSNITHISQQMWEKIQQYSLASFDAQKAQDDYELKYMKLINTQGIEMLYMINIVQTRIETQKFMLLVEVPNNEAFHNLYELTVMMEETFSKIQWITVIILCCTCIIAIVSGCFYSNKIVKPLTKLTYYARSINNNASNKNITQDIKQDLDKIEATDKIGELINAFKNLVRGLSGLKKGTRNEVAEGSDKIHFPTNYYHVNKLKMDWRNQLDQLKNYEFDKLLQNDNNIEKIQQQIHDQTENKNPSSLIMDEYRIFNELGFSTFDLLQTDQNNLGQSQSGPPDKEKYTAAKIQKEKIKNFKEIIYRSQKEIINKLVPNKEFKII